MDTMTPDKIDLRALMALRPSVEAMGLRLLAGERVTEEEYGELSARADRAGAAFVAAIVAAFATGMLGESERGRVHDALILVADRISGMWSVGGLWDDVNTDRHVHALTMRLLDEKRRQGAGGEALWALYRECEADLSEAARHDVTSWLRALEG